MNESRRHADGSKKKHKSNLRYLRLILEVLILVGAVYMSVNLLKREHAYSAAEHLAAANVPKWIDMQLIEEGNPSRNGNPLREVNDIVVHYVANPQTTAEQNRNYFASLDSEVSSHFVVGLDGEIIMCIPLDEMSAASNWRNADTVSIEVCHPDETGKFNDVTYKSLVRLVAWLCKNSGLNAKDIIRHYDITGKICPKYFVDNEDAWKQFKTDVDDYLLYFNATI